MNDSEYRGFVFDTLKKWAVDNGTLYWDFTLYDDGDIEIDFNNAIHQLEKIEDIFPVLNIKIKGAAYVTFDAYVSDITLAVRLHDGGLMYVDDGREWFKKHIMVV